MLVDGIVKMDKQGRVLVEALAPNTEVWIRFETEDSSVIIQRDDNMIHPFGRLNSVDHKRRVVVPMWIRTELERQGFGEEFYVTGDVNGPVILLPRWPNDDAAYEIDVEEFDEFDDV